MGDDNHITFRDTGGTLEERAQTIAERYDMDKSAVYRHCLRYGLDTIEREGLDTIVSRNGEMESAEAD